MTNVIHTKKLHQINLPRSISLCIHYAAITFKTYSPQRCRILGLFLIMFVTSLFTTIYNNHQSNNYQYEQSFPTQLFHVNTSQYISISNGKTESYRLVLLWTSLFSNYYWHQPTFFNTSTIVSCSPIHRCQFTRDKNKLSRASIVALHLYDTNRYELPVHTDLYNHNQSWIFVTGESPVNFYYQNPSFSPRDFDQYFDRSISYKYESPFPVFYPIIKSRLSSNDKQDRADMENERQINRKIIGYKKKPIAWVVSNCRTFSQREKYVKELSKFIQIDIYGQCGIQCPKTNNRKCNMNLTEYYFYLAFENSRCKSYITEKFWNIIADNTHRIVPIVMGADEQDYKRIAPKRSYIHVNDYKTPEQLAKYLNYLINNSEEYLEYLKWREHTRTELKNPSAWNSLLCPLCQMAYENPTSSINRLNFSTWFDPKHECHHDDVNLLKICKQGSLKTVMSIIHNVKCP